MVEQLDLFTTYETNEEKGDRFPQESSLTPRQWALYRLIERNSKIWHRKTTQREIYDELSSYGYEWNDSPTAHDHCSAIWGDVAENNLSLEHDAIIISNNFEYWIGSKRETERFLQKLWKDLSPRLNRYWNYVRKVGYDGQGKIYDKNLNPVYEEGRKVTAKTFFECFNDYDISIQQYVEETKDEK